MTTELARTLDFTAEQRQMILHTYAAGASPSEFAVLMEVAKARNLNPLTRQIYFVKLSGKWTFQVSIDGLRAIAQRSGLYAGQDAPLFQYDGKGGIISCSVSAYRKDWTRPAVGIAFMKEFSTGQNLWASKPHVMLGKVAEAIALRKAFSEEMSGLYAEGELDQSVTSSPAPVRQLQVAPKPAAAPAPVDTETGEVLDYDPADLAVFDQTPAADVAAVPFGKKQGTPVTQLTLKDLDWYEGAARKSIADPDKARFAAKEQVWLDAIVAEKARRHA